MCGPAGGAAARTPRTPRTPAPRTAGPEPQEARGLLGRLDDMLRACRPFIDRGWLVPIATFDPEFGGLGHGDARCRSLLFGDSAADIAAREKDLASIGVVVAGAAVRPRRGTGAILKRLFRKWLYA